MGLNFPTLGDLEVFLLLNMLGLVCPLLGPCRFLGKETCLSLNRLFYWKPCMSVLFIAALREISGIDEAATVSSSWLS